MALNISDSGGGYEPDLGVHRAICTSIIDLGQQTSSYDGHEKTKRESLWRFELIDEELESEAGEKFHPLMSQFYTLSLSPRANLRKALVSWRGKQFTPEELAKFDVFVCAGLPCNIMVGLKDSGAKKIESVAGWKGEKPVGKRAIETFSYEDYEGEYPEWMSDGIKGICMKSEEHQNFQLFGTIEGVKPDPIKQMESIPTTSEFDEEIPF